VNEVGEAGVTEKRDRARRVRVVVVILVGVLLAQFFRLQVVGQEQYELRSQANRLRAIPVPAPRGAIYDRDGRLVAENVPGYAVSLLPSPVDTIREELRRLSGYLSLDSLDRARLVEDFRERPNRPLLVSDDASFEAVSAIEERRPSFRRAVVEMRPRRNYPARRAVAHLVGYTGEISEEELERSEYEQYWPGRVVGKAGLEQQYDDRLGGEPGVRYVEVNAVGSIVSEFGGRSSVEPEPGRDLTLGLDLALQQFADSTFPEDRRGAVVAMDPDNGEVLLLYSHPSYDPNRFVGGISSADWERLQSDPDRPLLNRAVGAAYPPGSTFKLAVSAMAMRRDQAHIGTYMPTGCDGTYRYGIRNFRCWKPEGHGPLDLRGAIKQSCNIYFYQLGGRRLGLDALMEGADRMDFGRPTGLDFPYEAAGSFPRSRDWYDRRYGQYGWTDAVSLNLSIGQGENQQTVLRQAVFYSALATGESPVVPHLIRGEQYEDRRVDWSLDLTEAERQNLVQAMTAVVNEENGTAYPYRLEDWRVGGKTGTAQNAQGEPHSWFVGFAPVEDPEIVVASIVEFGHPDNTTSLAVPYAMGIVREYLSDDRGQRRPGDRVASGAEDGP